MAIPLPTQCDGHKSAARITPVITQIELLGNFQQLVGALESTQAASFLHQERQESAPLFGIGGLCDTVRDETGA
jgi:hypothetical protein